MDKLANKFTEVIFIGLPGPTHNYGGLSGDNLASSSNQGSLSHPAEAAMQALALARLLMSLGVTVGILPPQLRPHVKELHKYFAGNDADVIAHAAKKKPALLEAMSSSSAMWVANAATATPMQDSEDGKLHITVANLHTNIHRRIEALDTYLTLRQVFGQVPHCTVDLPLKGEDGWRDEGAANHMRMAPMHAARGLNVFVYGTDSNPSDPKTARQTLATSQEIIARHKLHDDAAICVKQSGEAINQGVFHNDVIAVANENMLLVHEDAYALGKADLDYIAESYAGRTGVALTLRVVKRNELSIEEAVNTYFFNSQLVTLPDGSMAIIAPKDIEEHYSGKALKLMQSIVAERENPINALHLVDLKQSMRNGGGPACLRLRVLMEERQVEALKEHKRVIMDETGIKRLEDVVLRTYPDTLRTAQIDYETYLHCKETLQAIGICLGLKLLPD
jgi:succinylarginine dihydrolase